jgi:iron complex outermembrane receptor protein
MINLPRKLRLGSAMLALASSLAAAPALAQPSSIPDEPTDPAAITPQQQDSIVITGSRIRRDPLDQSEPVVFIDSEDIAKTGLTSTADVLQRLPSSGGALNTRFNNSGNFGNPPDGGGVGAGAAEVDLRYLGSKRVLVLVDGLRYVNGASASGVPGATDLNSIPESMIERIEVLQSGASAIYGSDAIAGVVNIITRREQQGFQASAQLGIFEEGDGFSQNYQLTWGAGDRDSGTRIVVGGNYVRQDPVSASDRGFSQFPTPGATACDPSCSSGTPLGRFIVLGLSPSLTLRNPVLTGAPPVFNPADPYDPASDFKAFTDADRFNFAPFNYVSTPNERYGVFANLTQRVAEDVELALKAVYNRRNSKNQAAPLPLFIGPAAGNGNLLDRISIHVTNPFNPFGVTLESGRNLDNTLNGNTPNYDFIGRRFVENGPRRYDQRVETMYFTATLDGSFEMGDHDWYWDVNGVYGHNEADQTMLGNVHAGRLAQALGPLVDCTGACVPFNIFGGAGSITQPMIDFVSFVQRDSSEQTLWDFSANLTGELFDLPGGAAGIAVGLVYRDLDGEFVPDPVIQAGLGSDIPAQRTGGGYNVKEAYAELRLPLLRDTPFFHRLELSGAARYSDYSRSGSTTTFAAGVNWEPIEDLLFRGSWAQGFRAPSIGELFGSPSRFDQELTDPCSDFLNNGASATVIANCIAEGVPADGSYVQNNIQLSVLTGGNIDLEPEKSENWVLGAVYSPRAVPRLSLEANYFNFKVDNAIQAIDAEVLLGRCYEEADAFSCATIGRTPSGQVTQISGFLQNIASIETDGLDVTFNYRTGETGAGRFGLYWTNTFLFNYHVTVPATGGVTVIEREGTEQGSPDQAFPKHKSTAILDWSLGEFGATLTGRYIAGVEEADGNQLGSRFYTDMQLRWLVADRFGFALGVNNLFGKDPPGCFTCGLNNMDPTTYDVPGPFFYAKASLRM